LDRVENPITEPIVAAIDELIGREKTWIERRLRENREKAVEDLTVPEAAEEADEEDRDDNDTDREG